MLPRKGPQDSNNSVGKRQADHVINMAARGKRQCYRKLLLCATPPLNPSLSVWKGLTLMEYIYFLGIFLAIFFFYPLICFFYSSDKNLDEFVLNQLLIHELSLTYCYNVIDYKATCVLLIDLTMRVNFTLACTSILVYLVSFIPCWRW